MRTKELELTEIGDSAPKFLSRKNEAESIDATVNIIGLEWFVDELLIGGSDDQTLPFIRGTIKIAEQLSVKLFSKHKGIAIITLIIHANKA